MESTHAQPVACVYRPDWWHNLYQGRLGQRLQLVLVRSLTGALGSLPPWFRYRLSDACVWLLRDVVRYRTRLVDKHMRLSFPEKTDAERRALRNRFYTWLGDLFLETFAMQTASRKAIHRLCDFPGEAVLQDLHDRGHKHYLVVMGHYGNWEVAGQRWATSKLPTRLIIVYKRIRSIGFDKAMYDIRVRYGLRLIEYAETQPAMAQLMQEASNAYAFIADQAPHKGQGLWTTFLYQDTAFFLGWARYAQQYNLPVVFIDVRQPRRGRYSLNVEVLTETPNAHTQPELVEQFARRLEQSIREQPFLWLWSHKRWKHARTETASAA